MNKKSHIFMLFLIALIWGTTFVAQRIGAGMVGPFTFFAVRSYAAVIFLIPLVKIMDKVSDRRGVDNRRPRNARERRLLLIGGIITGLALGTASIAQQSGMAYTTASKAGFLTTIYIVIVPVFSILLGKKPPLHIWISIFIALIGTYLMCMNEAEFSLRIGDAYMLLCALIFAVDITAISYFSPRVDGVRLSRNQLIVISILCTPVMLLAERPTAGMIIAALPSILYAGIFSSGIAYTLQIIAQEDINPALASLIMSLESVFSALSGWIILNERMSGREILGAAVIFAAVLLAQIDFPHIFPRKNQ